MRGGHRALRRRSVLLVVAAVLLAGCADFSTEPPAVTIQPSLSPAEMHPQTDARPLPTSAGTPSPTSPESSGASSTESQDPCRPADQTIVAACLTTPWGLAVLPDGGSALVGERTTGRILQVAPQTDPVPVAQVDGIDASGDGGLLGLAVSPHYVEDGLLYAFVTTDTDNRIIRIARGDVAKPIFTGIPKGGTANGGRIAFGPDGYLYIATGNAGTAGAGADPASLAGKVLRIDEFGRPAPASASSTTSSSATPPSAAPSAVPPSAEPPPPAAPSAVPTSTAESSSADATPPEVPPASTDTTPPALDPLQAVFATGLVDPTGICQINAGVGVVDRVGTADVLTVVTAGGDQSKSSPVWSFPVSEGGAVDCAQTETVLGATSLDAHLVTALTLGSNGGFTGQPRQLVKDVYGRLLTLEAGPQGVFWATTSNKDGFGQPQPRDDLVIVIPDGGGGGGDDRD